jgi:hypothetical protein
MKKYITRIFMSLALIASVATAPLLVPEIATARTVDTACEGVKAAGGPANCTGNNLEVFLTRIVNILLFIIGTISVIMIIVGGLRYVLSGGDAGSIKAGKDTVIYAIIGLVVAIMAYAIVNFVLSSL